MIMYEINVTDKEVAESGEYALTCKLFDGDNLVKKRVLTMTYNQFNNDMDARIVSWAMTFLQTEGLESFEGVDSASQAISEGLVSVSNEF